MPIEAFSTAIDIMYMAEMLQWTRMPYSTCMPSLVLTSRTSLYRLLLKPPLSAWGKETGKVMLNLFTMTHSAGAEKECELL